MPIQFFYNGSELEGLMFTREKSYLKPNFDKESDMDDFLDEVRDSASDYIRNSINREDLAFFYPRGKHLKIVYGFTLLNLSLMSLMKRQIKAIHLLPLDKIQNKCLGEYGYLIDWFTSLDYEDLEDRDEISYTLRDSIIKFHVKKYLDNIFELRLKD